MVDALMEEIDRWESEHPDGKPAPSHNGGRVKLPLVDNVACGFALARSGSGRHP